MNELEDLFERNRAWAQWTRTEGPVFFDRLAELNVMEQIENIARTEVVSDAWRCGQPLTLHGWIFCVRDGLRRGLHVSRAGPGPDMEA